VTTTATPPRPPRPASGAPAIEVVHGPRDRREVALTFHGAGDPALATSLLGVLERAGAQATVLAVGTWLGRQPPLARRIVGAGHELGNTPGRTRCWMTSAPRPPGSRSNAAVT